MPQLGVKSCPGPPDLALRTSCPALPVEDDRVEQAFRCPSSDQPQAFSKRGPMLLRWRIAAALFATALYFVYSIATFAFLRNSTTGALMFVESRSLRVVFVYNSAAGQFYNIIVISSICVLTASQAAS